MKERVIKNCRLWLVCLGLILAISFTSPTDARYLPTRSDESGLVALKELITNILGEAQQHERELEHDRERQQLLARSARFFSTQNARAKQLARRYYLEASRPNDEDHLNRLLLDASFLQRRSAELMPPASLTDLDGGDLSPAENSAKLSTTKQSRSQLKVVDKEDG